MNQPIAMGKISANGTILQATPGITVSTNISQGNMNGQTDVGYVLTLPDRLVCDANYIIQLTAENYGEDGPDYSLTSIAYRYQWKNGFEVIIWADRSQTGAGWASVYCNWNFTIYDNPFRCKAEQPSSSTSSRTRKTTKKRKK